VNRESFMNFPHNFIAIEGNIGAGKTTLCKMLELDFGSRLILEQFTDNPFLPMFYDNPERYAFPVELFFMTERHKQLQEAFSQPDLFHSFTVSDYYFIKTLLFAKNNLNPEEYRLFQRLFHTLNASFPKPDLLVYLHRSVEDLQKNIEHRGRDMEQEIKPEYLKSVQNSYFDYFKQETEIPILILDIEGVHFWNNEELYQGICKEIGQVYEKRVHQKKIVPNGSKAISILL